MAQHNRNWIFSWFLPALAEKQCSFGDCWSESVNEGRRLSPYTSFSPAQGENILRCTAFLYIPAAARRAANCSWSWRWELLSCTASGAAQGQFYAEVLSTLFLQILPSPSTRLGDALNWNTWIWVLLRNWQHFTSVCAVCRWILFSESLFWEPNLPFPYLFVRQRPTCSVCTPYGNTVWGGELCWSSRPGAPKSCSITFLISFKNSLL